MSSNISFVCESLEHLRFFLWHVTGSDVPGVRDDNGASLTGSGRAWHRLGGFLTHQRGSPQQTTALWYVSQAKMADSLIRVSSSSVCLYLCKFQTHCNIEDYNPSILCSSDWSAFSQQSRGHSGCGYIIDICMIIGLRAYFSHVYVCLRIAMIHVEVVVKGRR